MAADGRLSFEGRVALVTGAGSGLGRDYARELARRGAKVVVNDYGGVSAGRDAGGRRAGEKGTIVKAQGVVDEIVEEGGTAVADGGDVASYDEVRRMVALAVERFGRLDIAIVNAGVYRDRRMHNVGEEDYDITMGVAVKGAFNVARHAWPVMTRQRYGRIVLTSSDSSWGGKNYLLYGTAKSAMIGMVNNLKIEGHELNIKVNGLMAGATTALTTALTEGLEKSAAIGKAKTGTLAAGPELVTPAVIKMCHESCVDSGEIVAAEHGTYGRVALVKGPVLWSTDGDPGAAMRYGKPRRSVARSAEWVHARWDRIMGVGAGGRREVASPAWREQYAMGVPVDPTPFGRNPEATKKEAYAWYAHL